MSGGTITTPSYGFGEKPASIAGLGYVGAGMRCKCLPAACPDGCFAAVQFLVSLSIRGGSEVSEYIYNVFTTETPVAPEFHATRPQDTTITPSSGRVYVYVKRTGDFADCQQIPVACASSH